MSKEVEAEFAGKKMGRCSLNSISFGLLILTLITHTNSTSLNVKSVDIINTTCKQCGNKYAFFNYEFCLTSLQAISLSHATNLEGLAIIALELALENASSTVLSIEKMISSKAFDPFATESLRDCLELYADAESLLVNSIAAFLSEHYDAANLMMSLVMQVTSACQEGFNEKEGDPLTKENYNLFELSVIPICIISLLPSNLPSVPSYTL